MPGDQRLGRRVVFGGTIVTIMMVATAPSVCQVPVTEQIRVHLAIEAADQIRTELSSYLKRELRTLGDVSEVEEGSRQFDINIIGTVAKNQGGVETGFILSIVVNKYIDSREASLENECDGKFLEMLVQLVVFPEGHYLMAGPLGDLRATCERLIAKIDSEKFEVVRRFRRERR